MEQGGCVLPLMQHAAQDDVTIHLEPDEMFLGGTQKVEWCLLCDESSIQEQNN